MKKLTIVMALILIVLSVFTINAQQVDTIVLNDIENVSTISEIDQFISKYEPKISNKMGDLWSFVKATTGSMFTAFVRYLMVKDGFPIIMGLGIILLMGVFRNRLKQFLTLNGKVFSETEPKSSYTEYESVMIKRDNDRNRMYNTFFQTLPNNLYYIGVAIVLYHLVPYFYKLTILIISPEVRVIMELTEIYKTL